MKISAKRILALLLSLALIATSIFITGMFTVSAEDDIPSPYPVYSDIDFSKYTVVGGPSGNSYMGTYSDGSTAVYWSEVKDDTADGGKFIRYDTTNVVESGTLGATTWQGNHAFCPSETGERVSLPVNTKFGVKLKIRSCELEYGMVPFVSFTDLPGSLNSVASGDLRWPSAKLTTYGEWTEFYFTFTTPATEKACYIGFNVVDKDNISIKVGYTYDIDHLTLYVINDENTRVVDFSEYNVATSGMWGPSQGEGTPKEDTWGHVYKDATLSGGSYYNYYGRLLENNKGINTWYAHYSIAPTVNGSVTTSGNMSDPNNVVLPTSTTYRLIVRMKVNEVSGQTVLYRSFTNSGSVQGDATAMATLGVTEGYEEYVDVFTTPAAYSGDKNRFYISVYNGVVGDMNFDIDYIKLEKIETVSVTFNANGGNFSGATTVTESIIVGDKLKPAATLSAPNNISALAGWSTTADGNNVVTEVTKDLEGQTLYAVWTLDPHVGGYNEAVTVYDFKNFTPSGTSGFSNFWSKNPVEDNTTEDGFYLRYNAQNGAANNWMGNHALALSEKGSTRTTLPNCTTYEMTLRVRGNDLPASGMYPWIAYCDGFRGFQSGDYVKDTHYTTFADKKVYQSDEWTEVTIQFTTPDSYAFNLANNVLFDKFMIGFYTGTSGVNYCYDLDTVTLRQVTKTNFYVDTTGDGTFELYSTVVGTPGTDLKLPNTTELKEVYNENGTGYVETYNFANWYSNEGCTEAAILKFGNFDVNLYCKATVTADLNVESQVGFVGFDKYTEIAPGWSINGTTATISKNEAYSGDSSLKFSVSAAAPVGAELRNNNALTIKNGQSYKVSFMYKTDADVSLGVGTGKIGDTGRFKNVHNVKSLDLAATDSWKSASLIVNSNNPVDPNRDCVLALVASATGDATVYVDAVTVSAVTAAASAVKTENGIRFMFGYNCGGDNLISVEGANLTVAEHGVLVTGADNETALLLENAGKNGIMKVSATDMSNYFDRNANTGTTTYSLLLDGVSADDDYEFKARGYVKFSNGDVYYADYITASALSADDAFKFSVPDEYIIKGTEPSTSSYAGSTYVTTSVREDRAKSAYVFLPKGTVISSDKHYYVERWTAGGYTWVSNVRKENGGTLVLDFDAYCELTVWNGTFDDLTVTPPIDEAHKVCVGRRGNIVPESEDIFNVISTDSVNYIFISDIHTGAFLRNSAAGNLSVYEAEKEIKARVDNLIGKMTTIVNLANNNDEIDFIVIGGDLVNGYETPDSPMYQKALAAGEVSNIREFIISQIQEVLAPLKNSTKPVFVAAGNHDDNRGQSLYYDAYNKDYGTSLPSFKLSEIVSDRDWYNGVTKEFVADGIVQDANYLDVNGDKLSKYYYYDFVKNGEDKRVIMLDSMDTKNKMDPVTGEVLEYNGDRRMAYSADQLIWLAETLKSAKGEVFVFSHQPFVGSDTAWNSGVVNEIFAAYNNKTSYVNNSLGINVDFSNCSGDRILSYHSGHTHEDAVTYASDSDIWQIVSAMGTGAYDVVSVSDTVIYKFGKVNAKTHKLQYPDLD